MATRLLTGAPQARPLRTQAPARYRMENIGVYYVGEQGERSNVVELWMFGLPGSPEGTRFLLAQTSSQQWEIAGSIEIPPGVDAIDCIAKNEDGQDIGFLHLGCKEMMAAAMRPNHRFVQNLELWDAPGQHLTMSLEVAWIRPTAEEIPVSLHGYALELIATFDGSEALQDIDMSVTALRKAVQWIPAEHWHTLLCTWLWDLARALQHRFRRTGKLEDLIEAIATEKKAVRLTPEAHPDLPASCHSLAVTCMTLSKQTNSLVDMSDTISAFQRVVKLSSGPQAETSLHVLGTLLFERFQRTGSLLDINEAISTLKALVELTPPGRSGLSDRLKNLGVFYLRRFERGGSLSDIAEAITVFQSAVQATVVGDPDLPERLNDLASAYLLRFQHASSLADATEAISTLRKALELSQEGDSTLPATLGTLASTLLVRYDRTGSLADVSEAVSANQRGVELAPLDDPFLPSHLNNLSQCLGRRYERTGEVSDADSAISSVRKSIELTPGGHTSLPIRLSNLGRLLGARFSREKDITDISEAITVLGRAVSITPEGHATLARRLIDFAMCFHVRGSETGSTADFATSASHFKSAANSTSSPPRVRLEAATNWARTITLADPNSVDVIDAFDTAISLVALIAGLDQTVKGRYEQLQNISSIALEAAAAACRLERLDKAVEWLEQGRCLVWSQLTSLRTPLDDLRQYDNHLAQRVMDLSMQLESASSNREGLDVGMSISKKMSVEDEAHSQLKLAKDWDKILANVRSIPGFESFLRPSPCSAILQHLPSSGPIVVVNVGGDRCDAIALLAGLEEPLHIPLPHFSSEKAHQYRSQLAVQVRSHGLRMRGDEVEDEETPERSLRKYQRGVKGRGNVSSVLRALWIEVVKPILDILGFSKSSETDKVELPRIWWCPTGPLSFLPLHAAGIYGGHDVDTILDYAVSSYIPTVATLTDRVRSSRPNDETMSGLFLTSQPNAPGTAPIPGTTGEVNAIHAMALAKGVRVLNVEGGSLTVDESLKQMEGYSCVHLACHATQNANDPLRSRFIFHTGSLDLNTILQRNLRGADLAFLSACQTSTGEEKLSDEAVHLAAGMLAAGYRRVVATMWSIGDRHAPVVAKDFYEHLWTHEEGQRRSFDGMLSAYSLHHAIQALRRRLDESEESFLSWIPYVHFGY